MRESKNVTKSIPKAQANRTHNTNKQLSNFKKEKSLEMFSLIESAFLDLFFVLF